jgi:1,4-alpha-glucan branching enzyme
MAQRRQRNALDAPIAIYIDFLRQFNQAIYKHYPDVQTIAEEATAWPMISRPT